MTRLKLTMSLLFSIVPLGAQTRYVVTDLGSLGGVNPFEASASPASAQSINNAGQVAGYSYLPNNGGTRGFRTAPNSPINPATDAIPTLGGTSSAEIGRAHV